VGSFFCEFQVSTFLGGLSVHRPVIVRCSFCNWNRTISEAEAKEEQWQPGATCPGCGGGRDRSAREAGWSLSRLKEVDDFWDVLRRATQAVESWPKEKRDRILYKYTPEEEGGLFP
jgi:hypothetical protein